MNLALEVETWSDVHHPAPLSFRRTKIAVPAPGGVTVTLTAGGETLVIEADADGVIVVTRVSADPDDEGAQVYGCVLGGSGSPNNSESVPA